MNRNIFLALTGIFMALVTAVALIDFESETRISAVTHQVTVTPLVSESDSSPGFNETSGIQEAEGPLKTGDSDVASDEDADAFQTFKESFLDQYGGRITKEYIHLHWETEYACTSRRGPSASNCLDSPMVADSAEEAFWMSTRGYPPDSMLDMLGNLSLKDLESLSTRTEDPAISSYLSSRYAAMGEEKRADVAFVFSKIYSDPMDTAHYVYRAFDLLDSAVSEQDRTDVWRAMGYLQVAAELGDTKAGQSLHKILRDPAYNWTIEELESLQQGVDKEVSLIADRIPNYDEYSSRSIDGRS